MGWDWDDDDDDDAGDALVIRHHGVKNVVNRKRVRMRTTRRTIVTPRRFTRRPCTAKTRIARRTRTRRRRRPSRCLPRGTTR